jgi:hypothetical protein
MRILNQPAFALRYGAAAFILASLRAKAGARCRFRTCDPYRVKVMLYH